MAVTNLTKTLKGKIGWVSVSNDNKKIIAQGKTLRQLLARLKHLGNPKGFIMVAAKDYSSYVG
ncbi:MAG: hypothetical protein HYW62_03950 [Candidatus Levybacteria bacterium]|nr:hypothetical protein [Candidatus Levybacteria bacterium]